MESRDTREVIAELARQNKHRTPGVPYGLLRPAGRERGGLEEVDVSRLVPWYGYEALVFLKKICGHP